MQACLYRQFLPTLSSHKRLQQNLWGHKGGINQVARVNLPGLPCLLTIWTYLYGKRTKNQLQYVLHDKATVHNYFTY